jgi:hypothetical protein
MVGARHRALVALSVEMREPTEIGATGFARIRPSQHESREGYISSMNMKMLTRGIALALTGACLLGFAGCAEDNEAAIKAQKASVKGTIPGSRTAQAQTQDEYYQITPGVKGAGMRSGPRPDQGAGYPGAPK